LTLAQHGLVEPSLEASVDLSYLADTVIVLRYFEASGAVRQAVSVIKKRNGSHERSVRELNLGARGLRVGPPLREFIGRLSWAAEYGGSERLLGDTDGGPEHRSAQ